MVGEPDQGEVQFEFFPDEIDRSSMMKESSRVRFMISEALSRTESASRLSDSSSRTELKMSYTDSIFDPTSER